MKLITFFAILVPSNHRIFRYLHSFDGSRVKLQEEFTCRDISVANVP